MTTFASESSINLGSKVLGKPIHISLTEISFLNYQIETQALQILAHSKASVPVFYTPDIGKIFG